MAFSLHDTIAALASAPGSAVRGIIRISGGDTIDLLRRLVVDSAPLTNIRHPQSVPVDIPLDQGRLKFTGDLLLWPNHRSYTGEVLAELHLPGAPVLLEEVLEQIHVLGARPAERGEFTLRAFLAGRIDLVQAEAVLGVIDAGNEQELKTALSQLGGGLSEKISITREQLLLHLADLEAGLDFVEEDIEFVSRPELLQRLQEAAHWVDLLLQQAHERLQTTGRRKVVLAGQPNAGKSTLFNALAQADAALVSPIAGTTRDYLSTTIDCDGVPVEIIDTAGYETARDGIELAAAELRDDQFRRADLILWCRAASLSESESQHDFDLCSEFAVPSRPQMLVLTKSDLASEDAVPRSEEATLVSGTSGSGIELLKSRVAHHFSSATPPSEIIGSTAARCVESLRQSRSGLERAESLIQQGAGDELIAVELRDVLDQLGKIVGQVYTDDILDRIFSRFCIGK